MNTVTLIESLLWQHLSVRDPHSIGYNNHIGSNHYVSFEYTILSTLNHLEQIFFLSFICFSLPKKETLCLIHSSMTVYLCEPETKDTYFFCSLKGGNSHL
ncbi:hypothetical protein BLOT_010490 [Blomia tropicalis]|nr:hypothetical protein BLOT_010490 [Blomia tropicalis]